MEGADLTQGQAQPFTDTTCLVFGDFRQQNDKLLTAETGQAVFRAQLVAQRMGHQGEGIVAGEVTMLVVVDFEVVDIQHQHAQRFAIEGAAGAFTLEHMLQPAAVIGAGEGVDIGRMFAADDGAIALAHPFAEQRQHVLHQFGGLLEQLEQRFAVQAQHAARLGRHHIGARVFVVDKADFAGAVADIQDAHRQAVHGAEIDLELAFEQQVEVLVAVEGRQQDFAGLQVAGAKLLEQLADAADRDIIEQSQLP